MQRTGPISQINYSYIWIMGGLKEMMEILRRSIKSKFFTFYRWGNQAPREITLWNKWFNQQNL